MATSHASTPKAVQDCHSLLLWMIPHLDKFPRVRRFTLGERVETALLFVLEQLVEAAYSKDRARALQLANQKLERVLDLFARIIDTAPAGQAPLRWFPGDDLLTPLERPRGIPIGNLASQILANLYLDDLDHFIGSSTGTQI